jgi:hypothetical protein
VVKLTSLMYPPNLLTTFILSESANILVLAESRVLKNDNDQ